MKGKNVEIVYVPYTLGVSSTILAKRIINDHITREFFENEIKNRVR